MLDELNKGIKIVEVDFKRLSKISPNGVTIFLSYSLFGGSIGRDFEIWTSRKPKTYFQTGRAVLRRDELPILKDLLNDFEQLYTQSEEPQESNKNKAEK